MGEESLIRTEIKGVFRIRTKTVSDDRGRFVKPFSKASLENAGLVSNFQESYFSVSKRNVIRGMHFQIPPFDHAKLVTVVSGSILDVVLDIRKGSPTFGRVESIHLSAEMPTSVYIASGCAHGFLVLSEEATVLYYQSTPHHPEADQGIRWDSIGFNWSVQSPILSKRDRDHPSLAEYDSPFRMPYD